MKIRRKVSVNKLVYYKIKLFHKQLKTWRARLIFLIEMRSNLCTRSSPGTRQ